MSEPCLQLVHHLGTFCTFYRALIEPAVETIAGDPATTMNAFSITTCRRTHFWRWTGSIIAARVSRSSLPAATQAPEFDLEHRQFKWIHQLGSPKTLHSIAASAP